MIDWWWLLIACPISAIAGMAFTGSRWQRAWFARERVILEKRLNLAPNPYKTGFVNQEMARAHAEAVDLVRGEKRRGV